MPTTRESSHLTRGRLVRLGKFATVGAAGFAVNLAVFALLNGMFWYVLSGSIAWLAGNLSSYDLNRRFTFESGERSYLGGLRRHLAVYLAGFVWYAATLWLLGLVAGAYLAITVAAATSGVVNFVGSELWTFETGASEVE